MAAELNRVREKKRNSQRNISRFEIHPGPIVLVLAMERNRTERHLVPAGDRQNSLDIYGHKIPPFLSASLSERCRSASFNKTHRGTFWARGQTTDRSMLSTYYILSDTNKQREINHYELSLSLTLSLCLALLAFEYYCNFLRLVLFQPRFRVI